MVRQRQPRLLHLLALVIYRSRTRTSPICGGHDVNPVHGDADADIDVNGGTSSYRDRQPAGSRTAVPPGWGSCKGRVSIQIVRGVRICSADGKSKKNAWKPKLLESFTLSGLKTTKTMWSESYALALNVSGFADLQFLSTPKDRKVSYPFGNQTRQAGTSSINGGFVCWENHQTN